MQRVWGFDSRHPLWWDITPVVVIGIAVLIASAVADYSAAGHLAAVVTALMFLVPMVWRRRRPFPVFASQLVALLFMYAFVPDYEAVQGAGGFAYIMVLYNVALRCDLKWLLWAAVISLVETIPELFLTPAGDSIAGVVSTLSTSVTVFLLVSLIALVFKTRRAFRQSEQDQVAHQAVADERTRIAREMHDIIGHNLAVINALADGGSYAALQTPERAKEALEAIGSTSRQALSELRRVLSVLRAEDGADSAELAPQPGLSELGPLVDRVREAGLPVTYKITGAPWELSENQQLAVYRTVQEALTNVLKHAGGMRRAQVALDYRDDGVSVVVANSGSQVTDSGEFRGLVGLRERAAAFDGTMEAGPQSVGGWRVALWLPRSSSKYRSSGERTP